MLHGMADDRPLYLANLLPCVVAGCRFLKTITQQPRYSIYPPHIINYNIPQKIYQHKTMSDWKCLSQIQILSDWKDVKNGGVCNCSHRAEANKIVKFKKAVSSNPFIKIKNQDNRFFLVFILLNELEN